MKKIVSIACMLLAGVLMLSAQTIEEQKKKINSIKKDKSYLYAEITTNDRQTALDMVEDMLNQQINEYVATQKKLNKKAKVLSLNRKSVCESMSMPRGNMFRAFIYVKKSDIIGVDDVVEVVKKTVPTEAEAQPAPVSERRKETVAKLLQLQRFSELEPCLRQLKQEGRISSFDKYKELADASQYVLIVYNREGVIEALLSEGSSRTNLRSGQPDDVSNYKGRGAFGVKIED